MDYIHCYLGIQVSLDGQCPSSIHWCIRLRQSSHPAILHSSYESTLTLTTCFILAALWCNTNDHTTAYTIATTLTLKLTIVTLLLTLTATQTNRIQLVLNSGAHAVTKTPKFNHIAPIEKIFTVSRQMRESNTRFSLSHINLSQLVNLLTSALVFHSLHNVLLGILLLSYLSRPALTSRLKIVNRSFYYFAPVSWNRLPSDLRHVARHVTASPVLNSPVSDLSTSRFHPHFIHANFSFIWFVSALLLNVLANAPYVDVWRSNRGSGCE